MSGKTWVMVSGGFDPIHEGHIALLKEAKQLGDFLVVVLNNDNWLRKKKGFVFQDEENRRIILESIRYVDDVIISFHKENEDRMDVCLEIQRIRPDIFANGGDRVSDNTPELNICNKLDIKTVFNVGGGKINSSSELVKKVKDIDDERVDSR